MSPLDVFMYLLGGGLIVVGAALTLALVYFALEWLWKKTRW